MAAHERAGAVGRGAREQVTSEGCWRRWRGRGRSGRAEPHPEGGPFAARSGCSESLLDHEVSFAVVPDADAAREPLLRGHRQPRVPARAGRLRAGDGPGIVAGLRVARDGEFEYPERSGTVVALVDGPSPGGRR